MGLDLFMRLWDMQDHMFDHKREASREIHTCMYRAPGYKIRETLVGLRV